VSDHKKRPQRAAGTRTPLDVIGAFFRAPSSEAAIGDQAAFQRGESREVGCFLRGSLPPYPKRPKPGRLELSSGQVTWRPNWGSHRKRLLISEQVRSIEIRPPGRAEWNVKRGGKAFGVLQIPEFKVLVCQTERGVIEFTVPSIDVPLVSAALQSKTKGPPTGTA
jgi:hypothetical protein